VVLALGVYQPDLGGSNPLVYPKLSEYTYPLSNVILSTVEGNIAQMGRAFNVKTAQPRRPLRILRLRLGQG
jgi:hypothetical protein